MVVIVWSVECLQVSVLVFMCGCRPGWHVQSRLPGRKREWNLGLALPGAPQPGPLTNTWHGQQQPTLTINPHTPLSPLTSGKRE